MGFLAHGEVQVETVTSSAGPGTALTEDACAALVGRLQDEGRRVVFTNGVFDLLHPGHVRYLQAARRQGDALVVAIDSDASVRANKGPDRPVTPEDERAELVAALDCVDAVVICHTESPSGIIRLLQPDVLVKGADWAADQVVGRDTVEGRGGVVVSIPVEAGWSTTSILSKLQQRP
jgi:D-beta-D-heptose 7-phosphate kinase/D-beta-D-heptose 1-phosphate adenosyltransferase